MKNLTILLIILLSIISCKNKKQSQPTQPINDDKGVVIAVWKDYVYHVTVKTREDPVIKNYSTVFTFITDKVYNINDTVYFTNYK